MNHPPEEGARKRQGREDAWLTAELDSIDQATRAGGRKQPTRSLEQLVGAVAISASLMGGGIQQNERPDAHAATRSQTAASSEVRPAGPGTTTHTDTAAENLPDGGIQHEERPEPQAKTRTQTRASRESSQAGPGPGHNADRADEDRLSREEEQELRVLVDSMLITRAIPPQLPFKNRVGEVPDTRVLEVMQEIDETLGGRIDWPNVYVSELPREGVLGKYRSLAIRDGRTYPADLNADEEPSKRYGIHLDQKLVSGELTGCSYDKTMRHVLVHELQHAISHDNGNELADAARNAYDEYEWPDMPTAESRADMAMLLYAEMDQRQAAGGPALNELPADQRFEVVREVLTQYITPLESPPRDLSDIRLREMLRTDAYNHDPENQTWQEIAEPRTSAYLEGVAAYSPEEPFVPTGMDPRARQQEIATPLPELAARWAEERNDRVATLEEWEARYDTARGTPGQGEPEPAVRGLTETATTPGGYETLGAAMSGWKPGCSAFAERIERRNAAEESGAVPGERPKQVQGPTNERQTEEKSPRGARGAENDQSSGTAQRTSGRFQMTHGADENLKPGWYVEKHGPTPDRIEWIKGPGTATNVRDELRAQLGPGQDGKVQAVLKQGLDAHVSRACHKYLEEKCPAHLDALTAATKRVNESRSELQQDQRVRGPRNDNQQSERPRAQIGRHAAPPVIAPPPATDHRQEASRESRGTPGG